MPETAKQVCARTPKRLFEPVSLSDEGTIKIREFLVARDALYSGSRPCFAKWKISIMSIPAKWVRGSS